MTPWLGGWGPTRLGVLLHNILPLPGYGLAGKVHFEGLAHDLVQLVGLQIGQ